jgi:hypothetical protein
MKASPKKEAFLLITVQPDDFINKSWGVEKAEIH